MNKKFHYQAGLNLLEVSVALILIGLLVGGGMKIYRQHMNERAQGVTHENMKIISKALSDYAVLANRIPCPADPAATGIDFGWESSTDAPTVANRPEKGLCKDGDELTTGGVRHGIVPYQVLNIPYEITKDGWGRYITYTVSPVFTQDMDAIGLNDDEPVLPKCREAGWVAEGNHPVNASKARFCCAWTSGAQTDSATDLILHKAESGLPVLLPPRPALASGQYQPMNTRLESGGRIVPAPSYVDPAAFALISHGSNGFCAYKGNDTAEKIDCGAGSTYEQKNGAYPLGNKDIILGPKAVDYDDVVYWLTPSGLMAAGGASTCAFP